MKKILLFAFSALAFNSNHVTAQKINIDIEKNGIFLKNSNNLIEQEQIDLSIENKVDAYRKNTKNFTMKNNTEKQIKSQESLEEFFELIENNDSYIYTQYCIYTIFQHISKNVCSIPEFTIFFTNNTGSSLEELEKKTISNFKKNDIDLSNFKIDNTNLKKLFNNFDNPKEINDEKLEKIFNFSLQEFIKNFFNFYLPQNTMGRKIAMEIYLEGYKNLTCFADIFSIISYIRHKVGQFDNKTNISTKDENEINHELAKNFSFYRKQSFLQHPEDALKHQENKFTVNKNCFYPINFDSKKQSLELISLNFSNKNNKKFSIGSNAINENYTLGEIKKEFLSLAIDGLNNDDEIMNAIDNYNLYVLDTLSINDIFYRLSELLFSENYFQESSTTIEKCLRYIGSDVFFNYFKGKDLESIKISDIIDIRTLIVKKIKNIFENYATSFHEGAHLFVANNNNEIDINLITAVGDFRKYEGCVFLNSYPLGISLKIKKKSIIEKNDLISSQIEKLLDNSAADNLISFDNLTELEDSIVNIIADIQDFTKKLSSLSCVEGILGEFSITEKLNKKGAESDFNKALEISKEINRINKKLNVYSGCIEDIIKIIKIINGIKDSSNNHLLEKFNKILIILKNQQIKYDNFLENLQQCNDLKKPKLEDFLTEDIQNKINAMSIDDQKNIKNILAFLILDNFKKLQEAKGGSKNIFKIIAEKTFDYGVLHKREIEQYLCPDFQNNDMMTKSRKFIRPSGENKRLTNFSLMQNELKLNDNRHVVNFNYFTNEEIDEEFLKVRKEADKILENQRIEIEEKIRGNKEKERLKNNQNKNNNKEYSFFNIFKNFFFYGG